MRTLHCLVTVLASLSLSLSLVAQASPPSVVAVQKDYHFGTLNVNVPIPSSTDPAMIVSQSGSFTLRNDLTMSLSSTRTEMYPNLTSWTGPDGGSAAYAVLPDSRLRVDWLPSMPGTETQDLLINRDASIISGTRFDANETETYFVIGLEKSTGQSNASLNGRYYVVSNFFKYTPAGLTGGVSRGVATLDGTGGFSFTGQEQRVAADGTSSLHVAGGTSSYSVSANGGFSLSATENGAISPNGEVWFTALRDVAGKEVGISIAVKIGASYTMGQLAGSYRTVAQGVELDSASTSHPFTYSDRDFLDIAAQSPTTGTWGIDFFGIEGDPTQVTSVSASANGTVALGIDGALTFTDPSDPTASTVLHASQSGEAMVGTYFNGNTDIIFSTRVCGGSELYGDATRGTGAIDPAAHMIGWPQLGNSTFAVGVANARGAAPAVMPISLGRSPGLNFLGGTIYIDAGLVVGTPPIGLTGPMGVAGAGKGSITLPIPNIPTLDGAQMFVQTIVLDPGGPQGLAMSEGLQVGLCK